MEVIQDFGSDFLKGISFEQADASSKKLVHIKLWQKCHKKGNNAQKKKGGKFAGYKGGETASA